MQSLNNISENISLHPNRGKEGDFALLTCVIVMHELRELQYHIYFMYPRHPGISIAEDKRYKSKS